MNATETQPAPVRVERFDPRFTGPQLWHDSWRNQDRVIRYKGRCFSDRCDHRRTFAADDGENDPRGVLGDHATSPLVAEDYEMIGPDLILCFDCANEYSSYKEALIYAKRKLWKYPDDPSLSEE